MNADLTLPARFASLEQVRAFVAEQAEACGLEPSAVYAVQLATDEAFSNIIEHAYGGESDNPIRCSAHQEGDALVITLCDYGEPFDPSQVPPPDLEASLQKREVGGIGLHFIHHLMDEVQFSFNVVNGEGERPCNRLRMVKRKGT